MQMQRPDYKSLKISNCIFKSFVSDLSINFLFKNKNRNRNLAYFLWILQTSRINIYETRNNQNVKRSGYILGILAMSDFLFYMAVPLIIYFSSRVYNEI